MFHARCLAIALSCLTLLATPTLAQDQTAYTVQLLRPLEVGDTFRKVASFEYVSQRRILRPGQTQPESTSNPMENYTIDTNAEVLAVDEFGRATQLRLTRVRMIAHRPGQEMLMLPDRCTLLASNVDGTATYTLEGSDEPLPDIARFALRELVGVIYPKGVTEDQLFGSTTPRKIGEAWSPDLALCATTLSPAGSTATPDQFEGESVIQQLIDVDQTPCLQLKTRIAATELRTNEELPEEVVDAYINIESKIDATMPIDTNEPPAFIRVWTKVDTIAVRETSEGPATVTQMSVSRRSERILPVATPEEEADVDATE